MSSTKEKGCISAILLNSIPNCLAAMLERCIGWVNRLRRLLRGKKVVAVYDIVNAGPKHRFSTSDAVLSNCAADYGMGFDKNVILEKRFGLTMVQFMFVLQNKLLTYSPTLGHSRWTIDKTSALDILFMAIKNGRLFFPPYEGFEIYLRDLLSPYEEVNETGGLTRRRYLRDPARPDDFCMALCFATMLSMKLLYGEDEINIIPKSAFAGGQVPDGAPADNPVDPQDVLSSL